MGLEQEQREEKKKTERRGTEKAGRERGQERLLTLLIILISIDFTHMISILTAILRRE